MYFQRKEYLVDGHAVAQSKLLDAEGLQSCGIIGQGYVQSVDGSHTVTVTIMPAKKGAS